MTPRMLDLIYRIPEQIRHAARLAQAASLPVVPPPEDIVIAAMGGSAISADLLQGLLWRTSPNRLVVVKDYDLPRVPRSSLFFAISYSGNTEETLSAYRQAVRRHLPRVVITSGGELARLAGRYRDAVIIVPPGYPPRTVIGYLFTALLTTLCRYRLIPQSAIRNPQSAIRETARLLARVRNRYLARARRLARQLRNRIPVIYSTSPLLNPVASRWRCQLNENSKTFAHVNTFPELDHNEIVGFRRPKALARLAHPLVLSDPDANPRTAIRTRLTLQILRRHYAQARIILPDGNSPLARVFSLILLGDLVSYYLAREYGIDPVPVKPIEELKKRMAAIQR